MTELFFVLLAIFLPLANAESNQKQTIQGVYSDSRKGGSIYICVENNTVSGIYSEYGLVVGTINSKNVFNGTWYEGGLGNCLTGNFSLNFESGNFSGTYNCASNYSANYNWTGVALFNTSIPQTVTNIQCGKLIGTTSSSYSMDGKWAYSSIYPYGLNQVDMCVNKNGQFDASDFHPSYTPIGFDTGPWYRYQTVGTGSFYRANNNGALPGSSLWFLNSDGNLANLWWAGHFPYLNLHLINDTSIHSYDIYNYVSGTSQAECTRFRPIVNQEYDYYPYAQDLFYFNDTYYSSSSTLVAPILLSISLLVLLI